MMSDEPSILDLRDIAVPDPVDFWPPASGFWVLLAVVLLAVLVVAWLAARARRASAYRRAGLALLSGVTCDGAAALGEIGVILKRVALAAYPRRVVAPLAGEPWLAFLDRTYGGREFSEGAGRILPRTVTGESATGGEVTELRKLAARWIRTHRAERAP